MRKKRVFGIKKAVKRLEKLAKNKFKALFAIDKKLLFSIH